MPLYRHQIRGCRRIGDPQPLANLPVGSLRSRRAPVSGARGDRGQAHVTMRKASSG